MRLLAVATALAGALLGGVLAAGSPAPGASAASQSATTVAATLTSPASGAVVHSSTDVAVSISGAASGDSVTCLLKAAKSPDTIDGTGTETDTFPLTVSSDHTRCAGNVRFAAAGTYSVEAVAVVNGASSASSVVSYQVDLSGPQRCNGSGNDHGGCVYHWVELWYDAKQVLGGRACALTGACVWLEAATGWPQFVPGVRELGHGNGSTLSDTDTSDLAACLGVDSAVWSASAASALPTVAQDASAGVGGGSECDAERSSLRSAEVTQKYPS